jgi:hypothetical protein
MCLAEIPIQDICTTNNRSLTTQTQVNKNKSEFLEKVNYGQWNHFGNVSV